MSHFTSLKYRIRSHLKKYMYEGLSCPLGRLENVVFPCLWSWPGSIIKSHMACDLVSLGEMGKGHVLHGACLLSLLPSLEPLSTYISLSRL